MRSKDPQTHLPRNPDQAWSGVSRGRRSEWLSGWGIQLLLVLVTLVIAGPLIWMVGASFKSAAEFAANPESLLPKQPRWQNYPDALAAMPFWRCLGNTLILCAGSVIGTLVSCSMAAYAFALMRWPGRDLVFGLVIATMLLPWQATMIPRFLLIREIGLYDSLGAIVWPRFLGDAFSIFLLRQFFRSTPRELLEAARIDGCGDWGVFWRVVLPLSKPALITVGLFQFVEAWNDYGGPLLYLSDPGKFPLTYGLERFVSSRSSDTQLLMAAAVLFTAPIVLIFFAAQKSFVRGVTTTGLKE
ncbi:L-arabinose transport system permease protein AraQ [Planctomycetes bacterium MalM25]|nr:L-arabinose transport system permease protein AraQ [Planctomycetes bacterium MalM25]